MAVTAASNVTGCVSPVRRIARLAHRYGAKLLVDAAQLAAHRPLHMGAPDAEDAIDFLVFSAHKLYAPYGSGGLIGPRDFFRDGPPAVVGGGTVQLVTQDEVLWAEPPELEEAGTPNLVGAVALAKSLRLLGKIGMERIMAHERRLLERLMQGLAAMPEVRLWGPVGASGRIGVVPFLVEGMEHALVAAALGHEWGIGIRHGCFCAHPYMAELLRLTPVEIAALRARLLAGDGRKHPGLARVSLALYNTEDEIDYFLRALRHVIREGPQGRYFEIPGTGEFQPEGWAPDFERWFRI